MLRYFKALGKDSNVFLTWIPGHVETNEHEADKLAEVKLHFHPWTGKNVYSHFCSVSKRHLMLWKFVSKNIADTKTKYTKIPYINGQAIY